MLEFIRNIFKNESITRIGALPITECDIVNERILPPDAKSAIIFIIPYKSTEEIAKDGFSEYARIYDYHKYASALYERIITTLNRETSEQFFGFCDHSPINEKLAAAKCGLGVIGRNSLLIDKIYGSFVFIGSLLTTAEIKSNITPIESCINCGRCITSCPNSAIQEHGIERTKCLSAISQKKQKTDEEKMLLKENNIVWGCDICQNVCPHNDSASISPIPYFKDSRINHIDKKLIERLSDEDFKKYAFSYKGRKIVLDNIEFI